MKTTFVLDDRLAARLKERAAREGRTMSELVEAALRRFLDEGPPPPIEVRPLPTFAMGQPRVDVADRDALYRFMES